MPDADAALAAIDAAIEWRPGEPGVDAAGWSGPVFPEVLRREVVVDEAHEFSDFSALFGSRPGGGSFFSTADLPPPAPVTIEALRAAWEALQRPRILHGPDAVFVARVEQMIRDEMRAEARDPRSWPIITGA